MGRRTGTRRVGIADVALKAGVSHATVSRVMNGNFTVDPAIAQRVRDAAAELNYQPNPVGRSLALGKTDTIGIVVPDLANPTFQAILRGLSRAHDGTRFHYRARGHGVDACGAGVRARERALGSDRLQAECRYTGASEPPGCVIS